MHGGDASGVSLMPAWTYKSTSPHPLTAPQREPANAMPRVMRPSAFRNLPLFEMSYPRPLQGTIPHLHFNGLHVFRCDLATGAYSLDRCIAIRSPHAPCAGYDCLDWHEFACKVQPHALRLLMQRQFERLTPRERAIRRIIESPETVAAACTPYCRAPDMLLGKLPNLFPSDLFKTVLPPGDEPHFDQTPRLFFSRE
eukprot:6549646-Prymnesium_polylepis.1